MSSPATIPSAGKSAQRPPRRRWHWPPYALALVVAGIVLLAAFFANVPAVDAPQVDLKDRFSLVRKYEHGWPLRYVTRETTQYVVVSPFTNKLFVSKSTVWNPWQNVETFRLAALIVNLVIWTAALIVASVAAQYWRSRRRSIWQLKIADLFGLVTVSAAVCGWIAADRYQAARESTLVARAARSEGESRAEFAAAVPMALPHAQQELYHRHFERVVVFNSYGQTELASECSHLLLLREQAPVAELGTHLSSMPRLEALDLWRAHLPYLDRTRQATILSQFPAMSRLRGIHLGGSTATDADMAWLAKCRRLESINVSDTSVGDEGIRHLRTLPRLRCLTLAGPRITDEGCRRLATFPALEELSLNSRNIHDAGVLELARLKKLRLLKINAAASAETFARLQQALPDCDIHEHSLR